MVNSLLKPVFIALIIIFCCSLSILAAANETISILRTEAVESQNSEKPISTVQPEKDGLNDSEEDEDAADVFPQHLQEDNRSLTETIGFFDSVLETIKTLLGGLEQNYRSLTTVLKTLQDSVNSSAQKAKGINRRLKKVETTILKGEDDANRPSVTPPVKGLPYNGTTTEKKPAAFPSTSTTVTPTGSGDLHTQQHRTPEEYLKSLTLPSKGSSFNGKTIEQIAAEVSKRYNVMIEIINHLDVELTDFQLYLYHGTERQRAPSTVDVKTREVFTFEWISHGVVLYRVGDTGFSLHLFFWWTKFAVGFLENSAHIKTFDPVTNGCNKYTHIGPPDSMKCTEGFEWKKNNTRAVTIHHGTIYAKLTIQSKHADKSKEGRLFLTMEVFKLDH